MDAVNQPLVVKHLGHQTYEPVWHAMQKFTDERDDQTPDELWLVEHPPVFTQGLAGKAEHILAAGDIPVIQVDRGGQVTYHGPGQIVAYPLINLRRHGIGVKSLVYGIEQAIIDTIGLYGITAKRLDNAPGVYVNGAKMASLGLRIRKACSFHGLAFNINMDLEPFQRINPCGFSGLEVIQLADMASDVNLATVEQQLIAAFCQQLNFTAAN
ncbi:lipoyl(octanoyl) transferase LipB [Marinicella litoralis]|uniref:Octanoyltransferase n=1 Tax=Marinicella litoralis TaxID=644220 RepID=A0A4R6XQM7_9GAMM|nr:lipoyl(octanoyl) transferase LipB [Marinicella litoralis]TDR20719.1 lipoyl(octanoyl) transferase [Marinicella litoralis]